MIREGKGHNAGRHEDNYCVIDLETTDCYVGVAEIIEISAIKVRDNKVTDQFSTLVNPHCRIPDRATQVNHITDEMVMDAPDLDEVIDSFINFVGEDTVVGYNIASFDMCLIYDVCKELRGGIFGNNYIDVLHAARRCLASLENYKLETVSQYYALDTEGEHRALKDCCLTKDVYDRLYAEYGTQAFENSSYKRHHTVHHSKETAALQELQTLLGAIIEDGEVTLDEFTTLRLWMEDHEDLQGNYPFDRVFNALDNVLEDGKVIPEELKELQVLFTDFVDPVKSRGCHDAIMTISGKHVAVTGDFEYGSRKAVQELIETAGGINDNSVKLATDYVVVGAKGSASWKTGNYGGKIQKAMEMKDKGSSIEIVEESDFIPALMRIIECRNSVEENPDTTDQDWKQEIRKMLKALVEEFELPEGSLFLSDNYGQAEKTKDTIVSHTVYIWEPDFPPVSNEKPGKNKNVVTLIPDKIKSSPDDLILNVREIQELPV